MAAKKTKLLLFNQRARGGPEDIGGDDAAMVLAPHHLKAYLLRGGRRDIDIGIMTPDRGADEEPIVKEIYTRAPHVAGFGCYVWNFESTLNISRRLKLASPDVRIILGGPEVSDESFSRDVMKQSPWVDAIVRGEGELPLEQLLDGRKNPADIAAVTWRDGSRIVVNKGNALHERLDDTPSFYSPEFLSGMPVVYYSTSRGCVGRCRYCREWSRKRNLPLDRIDRDLSLIFKSRDMKLFGFIDSVLDDDPERLREILRITAKHNRRKIPVSAYFYFGNADPELFDLLEKAGFRYLRVGIESSNPETLRRVGRGERNLSHIDNALPYRDRFEIVPYIISHLPGETPQSFRENIKACFRKGLLELDFHCNRLNIYPGAPLHAAGKREGYVSDPQPPHHVFSSPGWSYESFVSDREFLRNVMALGKFFKPDDERFLVHNGIGLFDIAENIGSDSPGWRKAFTSISSDTISDVVIQDCMADEFEKYAIKEFKDKSKAAAVSRLFRLRFAERRAAESFGGAEAEYGAAGDIGMDLAVFVPCYYELPPGLDVAQIAASPETKIKELGTLKRNLFIVGSTGRRTYSFEAANGALAREMLDALAANRTEKKPLREILKPMPAERRSAFMSLVAVLAEQGALAVCASYIE